LSKLKSAAQEDTFGNDLWHHFFGTVFGLYYWNGTTKEFADLQLRNDPKNLRISDSNIFFLAHLWQISNL
jgi:hypothetical protein